MCRPKNAGVAGFVLRGTMRSMVDSLGLRRGFLTCAAGEIDKQDVSVIFLQLLSMLRYFYEDTGDAKKNEANQSLFQGLKIMEQGEEYTEHMGKYPVINLTLKSAKQPTFESAYGKMLLI